MTEKRRKRAGTSNSADSRRFSRSPFLISYWLGPFLILENYQTHEKVTGDSFAVDLLAFCGEPRSFSEIRAQFPTANAADLRERLRCMRKYSLLAASAKGDRKENDPWHGWESWSPAASHFHFSTRDVKYVVSDAEDFSSLRELAKLRPLPPRSRKFPRAKSLRLSSPVSGGEFARVLTERRTWRKFSRKPVDAAQLSELLWLSFGVQGWAKIRGVGRLPLKSSPSGGSLHPLEAYLFIQNVRGISRGVYHYDSERHRLELIRRGTNKAEIRTLLAKQSWFSGAAFVVFLSAVFSRTQWKYEHPRAYRVILAEAGHVGQTFCLTATALGLAPFCTMALEDSAIEKILRIDGITESVLYAVGAGNRPRGMATADRLREKHRR